MLNSYRMGLESATHTFGPREKIAVTRELRLKLKPQKGFHGLKGSLKTSNEINSVMDSPGHPEMPVEQLATQLQSLAPPKKTPGDAASGSLNREVIWGNKANLDAGDAGHREGIGPTTQLGSVL